MRRLDDDLEAQTTWWPENRSRRATPRLMIGLAPPTLRFPVSLGERMECRRAYIEAAGEQAQYPPTSMASCLAKGFSARVVDAFSRYLAEDRDFVICLSW